MGAAVNFPNINAKGMQSSASELLHTPSKFYTRSYEEPQQVNDLTAKCEVTQMHKGMAGSKIAPQTEPIKLDLAEAVDSFSELYDLLEEYSPMWYSEDVHDRAQSALILLRASLGLEHAQKSSSKKQKSWEYSVRNS